MVTEDDGDDSSWMAVEEVTYTLENCAEPEPLLGESEWDDDSEDNNAKAFSAETWSAEGGDAFDWAGLDDQLVKEGEE